ncbi:MAG: hypothetical protein NC416_15035 [Eubacterium sp.]|nr:hypothetical protein [Eubacterium sp.]
MICQKTRRECIRDFTESTIPVSRTLQKESADISFLPVRRILTNVTMMLITVTTIPANDL